MKAAGASTSGAVSRIQLFYRDRLLPRIVEAALGSGTERYRRRVTAELEGRVLELGFGSGRNLDFLPFTVTQVLAVEPSSGAWRLATDRIARSSASVQPTGSDAARIDLPAESVDHVLVTWSLCTIADIDAALSEAWRVLRPGGGIHFVEHGRSPDKSVARWQDRLTPVWRKLAGGCHLNRDVPALLGAAGFELESLEEFNLVRPQALGHCWIGSARKLAGTPQISRESDGGSACSPPS